MTKNGPRVAVHVDGMEEGNDVAFPPGVLAKVLRTPQKAVSMRASFTDLGGVLPLEAKDAEPPPLGWVTPGDWVRVSVPGMPSLEEFHDREGTVVEDLGKTKNGPRVAVHMDGMEEGREVAFPPGVLARVLKPSATSKR